MNDMAGAYNPAVHSVQFSLSIFPIQIDLLRSCNKSQSLVVNDLPPPLAPPTLVSLHCALNT